MQPSSSPVAPLVRPGKPDGVSAAVWIVIILSGFLAFSGFGLLAAGALTGKMQEMQSQMSARMPSEAPRAELERMMASQRAIMAASRPDFAAPVGLLSLAVAAAGIVCAIRLNKRRPDAVGWFQHVTIAITALEVIGVLQGLQVQRRIQPLLADLMNNLPHGPHPERAAPFMDWMTTAMSGVSVMTLVYTIGWGLAKIGVCLFARYRAGSPAVRAWIAG